MGQFTAAVSVNYLSIFFFYIIQIIYRLLRSNSSLFHVTVRGTEAFWEEVVPIENADGEHVSFGNSTMHGGDEDSHAEEEEEEEEEAAQ